MAKKLSEVPAVGGTKPKKEKAPSQVIEKASEPKKPSPPAAPRTNLLAWSCDSMGEWKALSFLRPNSELWWVIVVTDAGVFSGHNSDPELASKEVLGKFECKTLKAAKNTCQSLEDGLRTAMKKQAAEGVKS
jgi:hypothetical protein